MADFAERKAFIAAEVAKTAAGLDGKALMDRWIIRLPWLGPIAVDFYISNFARTMGSLLKGGVQMLKALDITREVMDHAVYGEALKSARKDCMEGASLSASQPGAVHFTLSAGAASAHRDYMMLGSLSGIQPGAPLPGGGHTDLLSRNLDSPRGAQLFQERLGGFLLRRAEQVRPGVFPFLPKRPQELEDLVLAILGHDAFPFENRDFRKSTTFDSGMGKEYRHLGQQTREQLFPMGHPERHPLSEGSISNWHRGQRIFAEGAPDIRTGPRATGPRN